MVVPFQVKTVLSTATRIPTYFPTRRLVTYGVRMMVGMSHYGAAASALAVTLQVRTMGIVGITGTPATAATATAELLMAMATRGLVAKL